MKTYYFSKRNIFLKSILGLLGLTVISCGTYQNKSYYDNDGVYGVDKQRSGVQNTETNKYKEYFGSNANNYNTDQSENFTDVESYSSQNDSVASNKTESYAGWGDNDNHNVTINVYNDDWNWHNSGYWNNYWGYRPMDFGIYVGWNSWNSGWCNPYWAYSGYYGPSWGWYNPYYYSGYYGYGYYGYNNWNNGYYGNNNYVYNHGRRGSAYNGDRYSNGASPRNYTPGRRNNSLAATNGGFQNPRSSYQNPPRRNDTNLNNNYNQTNTPRPRNPRVSDSHLNTDYNTINPPRQPRSPRISNQNINPASDNTPIYNTPRPRTSNPRSEMPRTYNDSPRSNDLPRTYDTPRSSPSNGSGSGSSSGGGGRGGRRG